MTAIAAPRRIDRAEVFRLFRHGKTQAQIAEMLGCSQGMICQVLSARRPTSSLATRIGGTTVGGGLLKMLQGMPADQAHWLLDQVPEGGTLIETIRAIITDAWAEDQGLNE